jgi:hypothetical protein
MKMPKKAIPNHILEQKESISSDYLSEMTVLKIADKYKISQRLLYKILRLTGALSEKEARDKARKEQVIRMYNDSMPICHIAEILNMGHCFVRKILDNNGFSKKQPRQVSEAEEVAICKAYQDNMLNPKICEKFNVSGKLLYSILRKHNISIGQKPKRIKKIRHKKGRTDVLSRYSKEKQDSIIYDYLHGVTMKTIFKKYNTNQHVLYRILEINNITYKDVVKSSKEYDVDTEEAKSIAHDYGKNIDCRIIRKNYKVSQRSIIKSAQHYGTVETRKAVRQNIKDADIASILKSYDDKLPLDKMGFGRITIKKALREHGIIERKPILTKYSLDENFFEVIDTPEKAQILGFLFADGNVAKDSNGIRIQIKATDMPYLANINFALRSDRPIANIAAREAKFFKRGNKKYISSEMISLRVVNAKMKQDLVKLGVVPAKTYLDFAIPDIDPKYMNSFLLGFFEGDGSVYHGHTGRYMSKAMYFLCQTKVKDQILNILKTELDIDAAVKLGNGYNVDLYSVKVTGNKDLIKLYHWFYKDTSFVMGRKHTKFTEILNHLKTFNYDIGTLNEFDANGNRVSINND